MDRDPNGEHTRDPKLLQERLSEILRLCWGTQDILGNDDQRACMAYWEVLKLRNYKDELFAMVSKLQLAKLDPVWESEKYRSVHPTKDGWILRYNQPDIFMFPVDERNGENAIVFEENGKWVSGEQHYPVPCIYDRKTHKHVGDAVVAALKAAEWPRKPKSEAVRS